MKKEKRVVSIENGIEYDSIVLGKWIYRDICSNAGLWARIGAEEVKSEELYLVYADISTISWNHAAPSGRSSAEGR